MDFSRDDLSDAFAACGKQNPAGGAVYRALVELKRRMTPVTVKRHLGGKFDLSACGACGRFASEHDKYCPKCGTPLDWVADAEIGAQSTAIADLRNLATETRELHAAEIAALTETLSQRDEEIKERKEFYRRCFDFKEELFRDKQQLTAEITALRDEKTHAVAAWQELQDAAIKEIAGLREQLRVAREAIDTVLSQNAHLADGDTCTLSPLKHALAAIDAPPSESMPVQAAPEGPKEFNEKRVLVFDAFEDVHCPNCGFIIAGIPNYCSQCGVGLMWDAQDVKETPDAE